MKVIVLSDQDLRSILNEVLEEHLKDYLQTKSVPVQETSEHLTRKEAMSFLGCSSATLIKFQKMGIPYYQVGRKILFKKEEILEFMKTKKGGRHE